MEPKRTYKDQVGEHCLENILSKLLKIIQRPDFQSVLSVVAWCHSVIKRLQALFPWPTLGSHWLRADQVVEASLLIGGELTS